MSSDDPTVGGAPAFWQGGDDEELRQWYNGFPLARALSLRCERLDAGVAVCVLDPPAVLLNPNRDVNGGHLAALADQTSGMAVMTVCGPGDIPVTAELSLHYLRSARSLPLEATARVVREGSRLRFVSVEVTDADDVLCLTAMGTWSVSSPRD